MPRVLIATFAKKNKSYSDENNDSWSIFTVTGTIGWL